MHYDVFAFRNKDWGGLMSQMTRTIIPWGFGGIWVSEGGGEGGGEGNGECGGEGGGEGDGEGDCDNRDW